MTTHALHQAMDDENGTPPLSSSTSFSDGVAGGRSTVTIGNGHIRVTRNGMSSRSLSLTIQSLGSICVYSPRCFHLRLALWFHPVASSRFFVEFIIAHQVEPLAKSLQIRLYNSLEMDLNGLRLENFNEGRAT
ncbi:hypothetical protein HGRIS_001517 [Hohenbuehelia grisea]|uniref:Uncharacterized protein n=1 Tax=Hohenbuehelia grisea TaxID=104357 RepID=A0ABR3JPK5_9AGAR